MSITDRRHQAYVRNALSSGETILHILSISIISLILLAGCQVVSQLDVVASDNNIYFKNSEIEYGITRGSFYLLIDISVIKKACEIDCLQWQLVRKDGERYLTPGQDNLFQGHLTYGHNYPGMYVKESAQRLTPGKYTVSATVEVFDAHRNPTKSMLLYRKFLIHVDETRDLTIEYVD